MDRTSEDGRNDSASSAAEPVGVGRVGVDRVETEPSVAARLFGNRLVLAQRYVAALADAGVVRGLIGPRERGRLWTRHLLNSVVMAPLVPGGARVVDIGTGAGLPGIPLAIARPDCRVDLVEPLERRTVFLAEVVESLGLTNCRVVRGRADEVVSSIGGADVVTSRAVAPLGKLAGWSVPLARIGGLVLALKGASATDELQRDAVVLRRIGLADVEVVTVGAGVVDPVTYVVRGRVVDPGRRASTARRAGRGGRAGGTSTGHQDPQRTEIAIVLHGVDVQDSAG